MKRTWISCCYYPTKVVFIDDDPDYFGNLETALNMKHGTYKSFVNQVEALNYLTKKYLFSPFTHHCTTYPEEREIDTRLIEVDTRKIYKEMYRQLRFEEISVIVTDYDMPGINGLEFCKQLSHLPIKKILLTGVGDEKTAINAFNEGIIDKFVRKHSPDLANTINTAIHDLQKQYFNDLSKPIVDCLLLNPNQPKICLDDPVFVEFFERLLKEINPCEYYMTDALGSFIFLDIDANPSWLTVKAEEEMYGLTENAEYANAPPEILYPLNDRSKIPYFHTDEDFQTDPSDWGPYLHPAKSLLGRDLYYYAIIKDPKAYDIQRDKILSYREYLQK